MLDISFNGITTVGSNALAEALYDYRTLTCLCLGNNRLGDGAVDGVVSILKNSNLAELHIGFNRISPQGTLSILRTICDIPSESCHIQKLTLSGNSMNTEGARILAALLGRDGCSLREIYIDQMNCGQTGKRDIAVSIATNRNGRLETIAGVPLGALMIELGSPVQLATFSNAEVLAYIKMMWDQAEARSSAPGPEPGDTSTENFCRREQQPTLFCAGLPDDGHADATGDEPSRKRQLSIITASSSVTRMTQHVAPHLKQTDRVSSCALPMDLPLRTLSQEAIVNVLSLGVIAPGSLDDLTTLANDVTTPHIKRNHSDVSPSICSDDDEGMGQDRTDTDSANSSKGAENDSHSVNISGGASTSTVTTEQIDLLSQQLEHMFEVR